MVNSIADAERIYAALSDGGDILMPIQETFFPIRFAQVRDRFGASWMILHERPQHEREAQLLRRCTYNCILR